MRNKRRLKKRMREKRIEEKKQRATYLEKSMDKTNGAS